MPAFPSYTGDDVIQLACIFLNDRFQLNFDSATMFPLVQSAIERLQNELNNNSVQFVASKSVNLIIPAGTKSYNPLDGTGSSPLVTITDFIDPNEVWERPSGSADLFVKMDEQAYEPEVNPDIALRFWSWRSQKIFFVGATSNREIQIKYDSANLYIATSPAQIGILQGKEFLAYYTASMAAQYVGENDARAKELSDKADEALATLISTMVNNMQGIPMRKKPYRVNPFSFRR